MTVSDHFGEAPFFRLLSFTLKNGELIAEHVLRNPYQQEEKAKGITGLVKMTSECIQNTGTLTLEFELGTDKNDALREVSDKMREVPDYPENVEQQFPDDYSAVRLFVDRARRLRSDLDVDQWGDEAGDELPDGHL